MYLQDLGADQGSKLLCLLERAEATAIIHIIQYTDIQIYVCSKK